MGSTDSSCCGSSVNPCKPETDSTYLKSHNRPNGNQSMINHTISTGNTNDGYLSNPNNDGYIGSNSMSPNPSPQPQSSSNELTPNPPLNNGHNSSFNNHKKKKKRRYNKVSTQIEILISENARAQSLLLCSKPEKITKDGTIKEFGFLKYLDTNLSEASVKELFSKFPPSHKHTNNHNNNNDENRLSVSQFLTILTLTVIIYRVKLHQLRTGTKEKPKLNTEKIKTSVEHLAVWIIRTFGEKQNQTKKIKVWDDNKRNEIDGEFFIYQFNVTQHQFSQNIYRWVNSYVTKDGKYKLD